jgi:hypothetical protein
MEGIGVTAKNRSDAVGWSAWASDVRAEGNADPPPCVLDAAGEPIPCGGWGFEEELDTTTGGL